MQFLRTQEEKMRLGRHGIGLPTTPEGMSVALERLSIGAELSAQAIGPSDEFRYEVLWTAGVCDVRILERSGDVGSGQSGRVEGRVGRFLDGLSTTAGSSGAGCFEIGRFSALCVERDGERACNFLFVKIPCRCC